MSGPILSTGIDASNRDILPARSPGALGVNDAAAPFSVSRIGDLVGTAGLNPFKRINVTAAAQKDTYTRYALGLVDNYTWMARQVGFELAASLMTFWRDGGDDKLGDHRGDDTWTNNSGRKLSGKKLKSDFFWPKYSERIVKEVLARHRPGLISELAQKAKAGTVKPTFSMYEQSSVGSQFWPMPSDIWFALGGLTIASNVTVALASVKRSGKDIELNGNEIKPRPEDELTFSLKSWKIHLIDIYRWVHGNTGKPGENPIMDKEYWLFHNFAQLTWKDRLGDLFSNTKMREVANPQQILHELETPKSPTLSYPCGDSCYARPFDVVTEEVDVDDQTLLGSFTIK